MAKRRTPPKPYDPMRERRRLVLRSRVQRQTPVFNKFLDVSTGHMSRHDNELLTECLRQSADCPVPGDSFEYGFYVYTWDYLDDEERCQKILDYGFSLGFLTVLQWARELDCYGVRFDGDGNTYGHLTTYEWGDA